MLATLAPQLERPDREPDIVYRAGSQDVITNYWVPQHQDDIGKSEVLVIKPRRYFEDDLLSETQDAARILRDLSYGGYDQIFRYLGIEALSQHGAAKAPSMHEATIPHPSLFISRLGALCTAAQTEPPPLTVYNGGFYRAQEFIDSFVDGEGALLANDTTTNNLPHDILVHGMAWALLSPQFVRHIKAMAAQYREPGCIGSIMEDLDLSISMVGVGSEIARCIRTEQKGLDFADILWRDIFDRYLTAAALKPTPQESPDLVRSIRVHCDALRDAAIELNAKGS